MINLMTVIPPLHVPDVMLADVVPTHPLTGGNKGYEATQWTNVLQ